MKRNGDGGGGGSKAAEKCETRSTWEIYIAWVKSTVGMLKLSPQTAGIIAGFLWMFVGMLVAMPMIVQPSLVKLLFFALGYLVIVPLGFAHAQKIAEETDC